MDSTVQIQRPYTKNNEYNWHRYFTHFLRVSFVSVDFFISMCVSNVILVTKNKFDDDKKSFARIIWLSHQRYSMKVHNSKWEFVRVIHFGNLMKSAFVISSKHVYFDIFDLFGLKRNLAVLNLNHFHLTIVTVLFVDFNRQIVDGNAKTDVSNRREPGMFCGEAEQPQTFISETSYVKIVFYAENYTDQVLPFFELRSLCGFIFWLIFAWKCFLDILFVRFKSRTTNGSLFAIWSTSRAVSKSTRRSSSRVWWLSLWK